MISLFNLYYKWRKSLDEEQEQGLQVILRGVGHVVRFLIVITVGWLSYGVIPLFDGWRFVGLEVLLFFVVIVGISLSVFLSRIMQSPPPLTWSKSYRSIFHICLILFIGGISALVYFLNI